MPLPCAAKHLCGMSSVPIERAQHHCANCDEPMHGGMCGHLLSELPDDVDIDPDRLSDRGKGLITSPSALICMYFKLKVTHHMMYCGPQSTRSSATLCMYGMYVSTIIEL